MKFTCPVCGSKNTEKYLKTYLSTFFFPLPEDLLNKAKPEIIKLNICNNCSFIYQVDVKNHLIELIYNEFYKHYNLDTSVEFQRVYRERTIEFMKEVLHNDRVHPKALDLGCGEGYNSKYLVDQGFQVVGVDFSEIAIQRAKRNSPQTEFHIIERINITNTFNVTCSNILTNSFI